MPLTAGGPGAAPRAWFAELAWLPDGGVAADVLIEADRGRFSAVTPGVAGPPAGTVRLPGLTLPGLANAHSHAFHRALRGNGEAGERGGGRGSFWSWRERMYAVADRLDPDTLHALARAVYAEMALAGVTCVGEFHYLHHGPGGRPYADPNATGRALIDAAAGIGMRITLLDTCYLTGGIDRPLAGTQLRFGDTDAEAWAERVDLLGGDAYGGMPRGGGPAGPRHARLGAAIHSVRAVPADQMGPVLAWSQARGAPLHVHLSEQPAENAACFEAYGVSPTRLLYDAGVLGPRTTAVHATHLDHSAVELLGGSRTWVCLCPTTERALADGIGPSGALALAGCSFALGSDSHAVIDLFEEARSVELDQRLATGERGHFTAADLLGAATAAGHEALGWPDAGVIAPGALADLVTVALDSPRLAGWRPGSLVESVVFAAGAGDVRHVVAGGVDVVRDGRHLFVEDVGVALSGAIGAVLAG